MEEHGDLRGTQTGVHPNLLEDISGGHEAETEGLHDGVGVPPAPAIVPQPRLDSFVKLDFWEATQSIAAQVRLEKSDVLIVRKKIPIFAI